MDRAKFQALVSRPENRLRDPRALRDSGDVVLGALDVLRFFHRTPTPRAAVVALPIVERLARFRPKTTTTELPQTRSQSASSGPSPVPSRARPPAQPDAYDPPTLQTWRVLASQSLHRFIAVLARDLLQAHTKVALTRRDSRRCPATDSPVIESLVSINPRREILAPTHVALCLRRFRRYFSELRPRFRLRFEIFDRQIDGRSLLQSRPAGPSAKAANKFNCCVISTVRIAVTNFRRSEQHWMVSQSCICGGRANRNVILAYFRRQYCLRSFGRRTRDRCRGRSRHSCSRRCRCSRFLSVDPSKA